MMPKIGIAAVPERRERDIRSGSMRRVWIAFISGLATRAGLPILA
jgi:hypothetical protein